MPKPYSIRALRLTPDAVLPEKAHGDDAGYDLFANAEIWLPTGESRLVPTGVAIALPPLTEAQIRPRSGLALKYGVTLLNAPGTVDAGYRGELGVILINHGQADFLVTKGMRIAQMVVAPVLPTVLREAAALDETDRGPGGFGSTGLGRIPTGG
ncbi:MAG: dUTP diphosphatase [Peptococcaceae bacterium]|jgi:dUTP pyrophosphatase|nr:dUTP diphosphatase [Peptococcaceae bacterium]